MKEDLQMSSSLTFCDDINALFYVNEEQDSCATRQKETWLCYLPKHLLWLVARSMNTLELITFPNGKNICISSASPNS
jgi:hypothetical protein